MAGQIRNLFHPNEDVTPGEQRELQKRLSAEFKQNMNSINMAYTFAKDDTIPSAILQ